MFHNEGRFRSSTQTQMRFVVGLTVVFCLSSPQWAFSDQVGVSEGLREWTPFVSAQNDKKWIASSDYEYSFASLNGQPIVWRQWSNEFMYALKDHKPYLDFNYYERNGNENDAINFGDYIPFKDSLLHVETGFGINPDYLYRFQLSYEYQHKLAGGLYGKIGDRYFDYPVGNVLVNSAGLIYYFGESYLMADYDFSITESRGLAQWGTAKWNSQLTPKLDAWTAVAAGERLYDVIPLDASDEAGYILLIGADFRLIKDLKLRLGYSYSVEHPSFIKRSVDAGVALRF